MLAYSIYGIELMLGQSWLILASIRLESARYCKRVTVFCIRSYPGQRTDLYQYFSAMEEAVTKGYVES